MKRDQASHPKKSAPRGIAGRFRIMELDGFDDDYLCLVAEPVIEFTSTGSGRFQFGALEATMDIRETERKSRPSIEFTWEGFDEGDEISGRGWAVLDGSNLRGHLSFHLGDDYAFKAKRIKK